VTVPPPASIDTPALEKFGFDPCEDADEADGRWSPCL
jgi:hypothetical protein